MSEINWIETAVKTPPLGEHVICSEDKINIDGDAMYLKNRTCMMAGIAGGFGYFGEGFGTSGETGCEKGLILDTPKYWATITEEIHKDYIKKINH